MKTAYKLIIAALAAAAALSSCTKDIAADRQDTDLQDGVRTIAISFDTPTKTELGGPDGLTPQFKGDGSEEVIVSNGNRWQKLTVQKDGNGAYITTELSGKLVAVYPSSAAKLNGTAIEGVKVPAIQTGRFADANIAMANIDEDAKSATFHNKTAILRFYVDRSVDVRFISLSSEKSPITRETVNIDDETIMKNTILVMAEIPEDLGEVLESPEAITSMKPLYQTTDDPDKRICYVSVLPFSEGEFYVKGITSSQEQGRTYSNVTLKERDIADAFIPYYINVRVGGTDDAPEYQRWSYCNLGAFLPEEAGYYYTWGNLAGYWKNGISDGYVFSEDNYNYTVGSHITTDLSLDSDAAYVAWANGKEDTWRMPTKSEFEMLFENTEFSGNSENSLLIFNNTLKLPLSGYVINEEHKTETEGLVVGAYWTATYNGPYSGIAVLCSPSLPGGAGYPELDRYTGLPIRPIYGAPAEEGTSVNVEPIDPLTEGRVLY